jgi:hypothetical protein
MAGTQPIIDDIDRITNEPSLNGRIAAMSDGARQMLASATGGQLVFDPQVGQSLLNTLNDAHSQLSNQVEQNFRSLSIEKLGMTAGGKAIGPFNGSVTTTGPNAFLPAHQQFLQNLLTAARAIKVAMDNYARTEQHTTQSFQPSH